MFEDQMVELLPARTTMTAKSGCYKPRRCRGGNTATAIAVGGDGGNARGGDVLVGSGNDNSTSGGGTLSPTVGVLNGGININLGSGGAGGDASGGNAGAFALAR